MLRDAGLDETNNPSVLPRETTTRSYIPTPTSGVVTFECTTTSRYPDTCARRMYKKGKDLYKGMIRNGR